MNDRHLIAKIHSIGDLTELAAFRAELQHVNPADFDRSDVRRALQERHCALMAQAKKARS